jgi:hypothetical protein
MTSIMLRTYTYLPLGGLRKPQTSQQPTILPTRQNWYILCSFDGYMGFQFNYGLLCLYQQLLLPNLSTRSSFYWSYCVCSCPVFLIYQELTKSRSRLMSLPYSLNAHSRSTPHVQPGATNLILQACQHRKNESGVPLTRFKLNRSTTALTDDRRPLRVVWRGTRRRRYTGRAANVGVFLGRVYL